MLASLLLSTLLAVTFDAGAKLGVATPFGSLESNHRGGMTGTLTVACNIQRHRLELESDLSQLKGNQQPDYELTVWRTSLEYHYCFSRQVNASLRAGIGLDWHALRRKLHHAEETGAVLGSTLMLTYVRHFGQPHFTFQLYGSELLEPDRATESALLTMATLLGLKLGVGYEF